MARRQWISTTLLLALYAANAQAADEVRYIEENGRRVQVVRQVVQRPINETRLEQREYTAYRERYTTDLQETHRTYQVPVTEQQWVPGYQRTWNVFAPPVLSYRLMPVTRWETRSDTVRVPITKREVIPEKVTQQVPVTTQRLVQDVHEHRIDVGAIPGGAAALATRPGDVSSAEPERIEEAPVENSSDPISRRR